jgi:hypothetical protein
MRPDLPWRALWTPRICGFKRKISYLVTDSAWPVLNSFFAKKTLTWILEILYIADDFCRAAIWLARLTLSGYGLGRGCKDLSLNEVV